MMDQFSPGKRPGLWIGLALALLMAIALQLMPPPASPPGGSKGQGEALIGGPFSLTDQNGQLRSDRDLRGRFGLIYFGYSFCPDVCPTDLGALSAGLMAFEAAAPARAARVQPVFITVDPERDTVAALKDFAPSFHPRLWALTGSPAAIEGVKKAYRVFSQKNIDARDPKNYLVDHTAVFYLIGPDGKYVAHLSGSARPEAITRWLEMHIS